MGGMPALCAALIRALVRRATDPFVIRHRGQELTLSMLQPYFFLGDGDALRAFYGVKAASAFRFCIKCANVVSERSGIQVSGFVSTSEPSMKKFSASDLDLFQAMDELMTLEGSEKELFEKSSGLVRVEQGMLHNGICRAAVPPSRALFDSMHLYFANGVCSWELAMSLEALKKANPYFSLDAIVRAIKMEEWYVQGKAENSCGKLARLLNQKFWTSEQFRGEANETELVMAIYVFAVVETFGDMGVEVEVVQSLKALWKVCREISWLKACPQRIEEKAQVHLLEKWQEAHQAAFNTAYGCDKSKPKHHWRMHLGDSAYQLGTLPSVATHEKKHQTYKGHNAANAQRRYLNDSRHFQLNILHKLLSITVTDAAKIGLRNWEAMGKTIPANPEVACECEEASLMHSNGLRIYRSNISIGDILIWSHRRAGLVTGCFSSESSRYVRYQKMAFQKERPWGTVWKLTYSYGMWKANRKDWFAKPSVWRKTDALFECVH